MVFIFCFCYTKFRYRQLLNIELGQERKTKALNIVNAIFSFCLFVSSAFIEIGIIMSALVVNTKVQRRRCTGIEPGQEMKGKDYFFDIFVRTLLRNSAEMPK